MLVPRLLSPEIDKPSLCFSVKQALVVARHGADSQFQMLCLSTQ